MIVPPGLLPGCVRERFGGLTNSFRPASPQKWSLRQQDDDAGSAAQTGLRMGFD